MRKAAHGDQEACALLYEQYVPKMFSICMRMADNRHDAEDMLQEAFILAFNNLPQLKEPHLFEPWLRKIVVNECIRLTKKNVRWQPIAEETTPGIHADSNADNDNWFEVLSFEQIHQEIKNLPGGCREIFNLYVIENYSHQQIAAALDITLSTSKSQYHRARQLLKERLLKQIVNHG